MRYRKKNIFLSAILLSFLVLLLCWPAVLNGSAIFFYDSLSYLGSAATAFREVLGLETPWADASGDAAVRPDALQEGVLKTTDLQTGMAKDIAAPGETQAAAVQSQPQGAPTVIAGRSIYYGAFLFVADVLGSLWLGIVLQALIVILSIYMTFLVILPAPSRATFLTLIMLGAFSSLPFYVSYLMPDFLTGVVILAVANLIAFGARMQRWMLLVWGLLLLFGLVSHTSHILIAGVMIVGWGLLQVIRRRTLFTLSLAVCISALGAAAVAEIIFSKVVERMYGEAPVRPPFLMAKTISDGPGYAYLVDNCDRHNLRICDFIGVLPQAADEILWSKDPESGVYGISDAETRRELNDQQMEFVFSVLRYDPFGQIGASFQGFIQQLLMMRLDEFFYSQSLKMNLKNNLPLYQKNIVEDTLLYRGIFPLNCANVVMIIATVLSIFYVMYFLIMAVVRRNVSHNAMRKSRKYSANQKYSKLFDYYNKSILIFVVLVVVGLFINAAITGILSTPHDRYQARVIWLVSFLSLYLICLRLRTH
jgi:hypothetical protein